MLLGLQFVENVKKYFSTDKKKSILKNNKEGLGEKKNIVVVGSKKKNMLSDSTPSPKRKINFHYGITIDVEAINPLHLLAVGIVISKHPGNKILAKQKFCFRTHIWKDQTAERF